MSLFCLLTVFLETWCWEAGGGVTWWWKVRSVLVNIDKRVNDFRFMFQAPVYHLSLEAVLILLILWLLFHKSYKPQPKPELTEQVSSSYILASEVFNVIKACSRSHSTNTNWTDIFLKEKDELIEEWVPEPLVPKDCQNGYAINPKVISGYVHLRFIALILNFSFSVELSAYWIDVIFIL